jgi:hypothetical protein
MEWWIPDFLLLLLGHTGSALNRKVCRKERAGCPRTNHQQGTGPALVCLGFYNKIPKTGKFIKDRNVFSLQSRGW